MKQELPALGIRPGRPQSWLMNVAVMCALFAPAFIQVAGMTTDPSFIYNRPPAPLPPIPKSLTEFDRFRTDTNNFVDDNFGLRAELLKMKILVDSWIGVSSDPGQLLGKNGWYFLKTDVGILDQFRGLSRFTEQELDSWIDTMERYRNWLEAQGIAFIVAVVPNQQTVYPEFMPMYANRVWPETRMDQLSRRLRERQSALSLVDLRQNLWAARQNQTLLYHKYENHWNPVGAFTGYSGIMEQIKKIFPDVKALQLSDFTPGSFSRTWTIPPKTEVIPNLSVKNSSITGSEVLAFAESEPIIKTTSSHGTAPTVLLWGDSFSRTGLTTLFGETFKWSIFAPTHHWNFSEDFIKTHHPDVVVYQLIERYLGNQQADNTRLDSDIMLQRAPSFDQMPDGDGVVGGYVDSITVAAGAVEFAGWAIDAKANSPAKAIYAYYGNRAVAAANLSIMRPELTRGMSDHRAGFRIRMPGTLDVQSAGGLRFFSVNSGNSTARIAVIPDIIAEIENAFRAAHRATP